MQPLVQQLYNFKTADALTKSLAFGQVHIAGELDDRILFRDGGLNEARDAMIAGTKRASEVMPDVNRRVQALFDEYWARRKR